MKFRDQQLTCQECGRTFFFTVTEQRNLAKELGEDAVAPPELCRTCAQAAPPVAATPSINDFEPDIDAPFDGSEAVEEPEAKEEPKAVEEPQAFDDDEQDDNEQDDEELGEDIPALDFPFEEEGIQIALIGHVKWYSRNKGYGFVTTANNQDIFFHRANLIDRNAQLDEDDRIEFQVRETDKGLEAFNVGLLPRD